MWVSVNIKFKGVDMEVAGIVTPGTPELRDQPRVSPSFTLQEVILEGVYVTGWLTPGIKANIEQEAEKFI